MFKIITNAFSALKTDWLDTGEYPFAPRNVDVDGHRLYYIDEGEGPVILFVHGTPSWSFEYRNVIRELRKKFRCIAPDHIGFGLSDKPKSYDYSTLQHSRTLERFIQKLNLKDITLVVHDFGGPIGLNYAIHHSQKVSKIIVLNSWLWSSENDPEFRKLRRVLESPLLPFLYRRLNFSPRFLLPRTFGDRKLSPRLRRQYTRPFANASQRHGPPAFARSLLNDQAWFEGLWNKKKTIVNKPFLFIWGMKDPVIKPGHLEKFESGFPNSRSVKLESCGHFPQEEQPEAVAAAILDFMSSSDNPVKS